MDMRGNIEWTSILNLLRFYFLGLFTHTPLTDNGEKCGLLFFFFSFFLSVVPMGYSRWVIFFSPEDFVNIWRVSSNSWLSLAHVGNLDLVGLEVFLLHLRRFRFSLRNFCITCGLGICVILFGAGWFLFLFWFLGSSLRWLGDLLCSGSLLLWYWCTYHVMLFVAAPRTRR